MCGFCEELKCQIKQGYNGDVEGKFRVYHKYKIALVVESYRDFYNGTSNRAGVGTGRSRKLNYCPECGRKLDFKKLEAEI